MWPVPSNVGGVTSRLRGSSPDRHQPVSRHTEFRGALLDCGGLVRRLDKAKPDGLRRAYRCSRWVRRLRFLGPMPEVLTASYIPSIRAC
jgi:hypothetical protein